MLDLELENLSVILITIFYFIGVPPAVASWFIFCWFTATGETVASVEMEQTASRGHTSAPTSVRANDQVSRDGQDAQVNQSQRISIASSVEVPRGGENQQQVPRVKQENRVLAERPVK